MALSNLQIKMTFVKKEDIENILYKYKAQMENDMAIAENQSQKNKLAKAYRQKIFTKINMVFRRQIVLDTEEAIKFYSQDEDTLDERIDLFFKIIEIINDDLNIDFIPDRLIICAFLRISADTYNIILQEPRADISPNLKNQIRNLEEFVISMTTNGLEQGVLNGFAWKKMQLKAEYGGNEIKSVESNPIKQNSIVITTGAEVQKRMTTNYNFPELLENKENDN